MGSAFTASAALQLPVCLRGIRLGRPTDLLVDVVAWQALGFVVLCGDEAVRFLPYAACEPTAEHLGVDSALMLLEDDDFYRRKGVSFRSLLGGDVGDRGILRDIVLGPRGEVAELLVERDGEFGSVSSIGATVIPTRAPAA